MTKRPAREVAGLIVCLTTFFSVYEIVLVCGYIWKGLFQGQTLFSCGKGHMFDISIEWIHLFVFSIWIRKRDGARVRRTLFLLGQSIIEPRGGFSCQLTFSPIYTRSHKSSSTSSTQNLPSCCQKSNTNNRKTGRCTLRHFWSVSISIFCLWHLCSAGGRGDNW